MLEHATVFRDQLGGYVNALQTGMEGRVHLVVRVIVRLYAKLSGQDADDGIPGHDRDFGVSIVACPQGSCGTDDLVVGFVLLQLGFEVLPDGFGFDSEPIGLVLREFFALSLLVHPTRYSVYVSIGRVLPVLPMG
jgi:hypothetical protein